MNAIIYLGPAVDVSTGVKVLFLTLLSSFITALACITALSAKVIGLAEALAIPPSIGVATAAILVEEEPAEENTVMEIKKWVNEHRPVVYPRYERFERELLPSETGPLPSPSELAEIVTPQLAEVA